LRRPAVVNISGYPFEEKLRTERENCKVCNGIKKLDIFYGMHLAKSFDKTDLTRI
jgi:hypothetical protein